jgi:hypothetical protein
VNYNVRFAADLTMMAKTSHGEVAAPRFSDVFTSLRKFFEMSADKHSAVWARVGGKNNQNVERRRRTLVGSLTCPHSLSAQCPLPPSETYCQVNEDSGLLEPEHRCWLCCARLLWEHHDGPSGTPADAPVRPFLCGVKRKYAKFSWEHGAIPMPADPSVCFTRRPISKDSMDRMYRKAGKRINAQRTKQSKKATLIDVRLLRTHSDRHGAVLNLKRSGANADEASTHCCMSKHHWEKTYGLEDGVEVGERLAQRRRTAAQGAE